MNPIAGFSAVSHPLLASEENLDEGVVQSPIDNRGTKAARSKPITHRGRNYFQGWKFTIFGAFTASFIVLFFNLGFLLYYAYRAQIKHQIGTLLFEGNCDEVHRLSTGFHLVINILSTTLLSASNFGMQCLAAPTRHYIDRAHENGRWFDVGVPSIHNLSKISRIRLCLWLCLASSSLPFHLMYNSAIYSTTSATAYDIFTGPDSLGQQEFSSLNLTYFYDLDTGENASFHELYSSAKNGSLHRLSNDECIAAFGVTFQSAYRRLLLVTDDPGSNDIYEFVYENSVYLPIFNTRPGTSPYAWICGNLLQETHNLCKRSDSLEILPRSLNNDWPVAIPNANNVASDTIVDVQYCMAEANDGYCKLQYSFPLIIIVIAFNLVKSSILAYMWLGIRNAPILTIGDAIASFLHRSDRHSRRGCLLTGREASSRNTPTQPLHEPRAFRDTRVIWSKAASGRRWAWSIILWLTAIAVCVGLLIYGLSAAGGTSSIDWQQALGSSTSKTIIYGDNWPSSLISNVLIANMPQLIFSFLYFAFNALITTMTLAAEWSGYAQQRKGLRVSQNPQREQRTNYFLSIPYRYSIPLLITSTLLHWLISQSLFMIGIEAFGSDGLRAAASDFITCGWSPAGMVGSIVVGLVMVLGVFCLGRRRFESAMPVASSCSLAITAACHPSFDPNIDDESRTRYDGANWDSELEEEDRSLARVKWGAVPVNGPIGHCTFTDGDVEMPRQGELYQ
ncbi:uncharacterized protein BO66DRAFT_450920 [Aspergillus aculeatinus CBS 121060]|uniref:Uncharacterized protein n=1 Tax=Aspergillus aculeatinus CBS 121060 TaxID=1448322 RepID=A0ACD1HAT9_9EURO|nr:hypothetical protein BO66DRAFT_450920 [Aspergillus aculeatinus CBS 121060]RAH70543.1 hypothetical protein BO66DRAFT_450920 [Aspergillus aculeatinus CBS 121060]